MGSNRTGSPTEGSRGLGLGPPRDRGVMTLFVLSLRPRVPSLCTHKLPLSVPPHLLSPHSHSTPVRVLLRRDDVLSVGGGELGGERSLLTLAVQEKDPYPPPPLEKLRRPSNLTGRETSGPHSQKRLSSVVHRTTG